MRGACGPHPGHGGDGPRPALSHHTRQEPPSFKGIHGRETIFNKVMHFSWHSCRFCIILDERGSRDERYGHMFPHE